MMTLHRAFLLPVLTAIFALPAAAEVPRAVVVRSSPRAAFRPLRRNGPQAQVATIPKLVPQADLTPFVGLAIQRIDVNTRPLDARLRIDPPHFLSVTSGVLFDVSVPTKLLGELENTGRFASGRVTVSATAGGVAITVFASERGIVDQVSVTIDKDTIDKEAIARAFALTSGADFEASEWQESAARVKRFLLQSGFPNAKVDTSLSATLVPHRFVINLKVQAGAPTLFAKRYFYPTGAKAEVIAKHYSSYPVNTGDRVDEAALTSADTKLESVLHGARYFNARVTHDVGLFEDLVTLRVHIDTGSRHELLVRGNSSIDTESLVAALDLENDAADRNPAQFGERIATYYRKRGFADAKVSATITGAGKDAVRYVVLNVDEGVRTKVYSRSYPCLDLNEVAKLRGSGPNSTRDIGTEIDSFLEEELPNSYLLVHPHPVGADMLLRGEATKRAVPIELEASKAFDAATYDRALEHVQELYRNEGYLHARVGPLGVFRATCRPSSPAGSCEPMPLPAPPKNLCVYDQTGLPLSSPAFPDNLTCTPNAAKGIRCSSRLDVVIPVKLGPQSILYDAAFTGARVFASSAWP